jgi:hypothetical protein
MHGTLHTTQRLFAAPISVTLIAVSSKQQQQLHENSDSTDDRPPSSLLSSSTAAVYHRVCRLTSILSFLVVLVVATYHQLCRRTSVVSFLAVLVVSLWNVGSAPRYLSHYSSSSPTYGHNAVHETYLLLKKHKKQPPAPQRTVSWSPHNSSTFMSSCLLWMDDNHYLVEWLAYHYTVLPLRRLIMCIDPKSHTSPLTILERYSSRGLMNITIWYEDDFFPAGMRHQSKADPVGLFLRRQNNCYLQCMKTLKKDYTIPQQKNIHSATTVTPPPPTQHRRHTPSTNTTNVLVPPTQPEEEEEEEELLQPPIWVTIYDMDEFMVFNHFSPKPRVGLKEMKPTVLEVLTSPNNGIAPYPNLCVPLSRSSISILESQSDVQAFVPPSLQSHNVSGMNFKTLRYPYTLPVMMNGKALLDLRYADHDRDFRIRNINCHRPLMNRCTQENVWITPDRAALGVYHYPGTLEQFTFRSRDARNWTRIPEKYALLNKTRAQVTERPNARLSWLPAFVEQVGTDVAIALLHGAGEVNPQ